MSLVERAAKRLEELGKAGSQGSGDLGHPASSTAASLIERAVGKMELPDAKRAGLPDSRSAALPAQAWLHAQDPSETGDPMIDRALPARREPKLGDALAQVSAGPGAQSRPAAPSRPVQRVELDLPKLASLGYLEPEAPESLIANEFRKIKRPLIQACQGKLAAPVAHANRIMVTSSLPAEGKSFISFNLALSIAMERDSTVLLIDADTTRRSLSRFIGIGSSSGLLDVLATKIELSDTLLRTNIERLSLLPAGQPRRHATELLASETMEQLVEELASRYADRILIFDTPPLLGAPEPAVLATHMGQVIVVVEADKTTHRVLTNALATIQSCPLVTTILNKTSRAESSYYYYAA